MSAQIPDTMPISDLLKSTGYDCPERLQGKTFEENYRETLPEVSEAVVLAALGA